MTTLRKSNGAAPPDFPKGETIPSSFFYSTNDKNSIAIVTREAEALKKISRGDFEKAVEELALGLLALGIERGERIALLMETSPEWIISDIASSCIGAISVPVYTTLSREEMLFLLNDAKVTALIFSPAHEERVVLLRKDCPSLGRLISTGQPQSALTLSFESVLRLGRESKDAPALKDRIRGISAEDPFSIIYSSGTTGRQKGVVLSHANILSNIKAVVRALNWKSGGGGGLYLSYLPLSHVFERMMHHLLIYTGAPIAYSRGFAHVGADIGFFQPSFTIGVPFFFERLKEKLIEGIKDAGPIKSLMAGMAMKINMILGPGYNIMDKFMLERIREKAMPGIKFFISGGAALDKDTIDFFNSLGIPVLQGYGLTETSPVVTVNTFTENKPGTVGRPIPDVEVKINEEGEILVKGPNVMKGYLNMPELTRETIEDGWLKTGDTGHIDEGGFLTITGRKKDLIITSVGKNVSPQKIEAILKSDEYIKEALVFGDGRAHLVALIVPEAERLKELATDFNKAGEGEKTLLADKKIYAFFERRINSRLKGLARFEHIRRFALIEDTAGKDFATPTMKLKREKVAREYKDIINGLYSKG